MKTRMYWCSECASPVRYPDTDGFPTYAVCPNCYNYRGNSSPVFLFSHKADAVAFLYKKHVVSMLRWAELLGEEIFVPGLGAKIEALIARLKKEAPAD